MRAKLDEDLLKRLGAYVDGELSATEAAELERLISQDAGLRQAVSDVKTANRIIQKGLFEQAEREPVPAEWIALAQREAEDSRSSTPWPLAMGAVLGTAILALCALTYVNHGKISNLKGELAALNNRLHATPADSQQWHTMSTAVADENGLLKDQTAGASSFGLSERLSRAVKMLRATGEEAGITSEQTTTALRQIENLRSALTEASDPIGLIMAEHRLHDHQGGQALVMIDGEPLERLASQVLEGSVSVPDLAAEGIQFLGGRLVAIDDQPAVHLAYRDHDGQALGLWMVRTDIQELDTQCASDEDLRLLSWSDKTFSYVLIGGLENPRLERIKDKLVR